MRRKNRVQLSVKHSENSARERAEWKGRFRTIVGAVDADESSNDVQAVIWDAVKDLVRGLEIPIEKLWDDKREAKNVDALYM